MTEKLYRGIPEAGGGAGGTVMVVTAEGEYRLPMRLNLRNHSPTGFAWGYYGSGPAQLALAICADALEDGERALNVYQTFKAEFVGNLEQGKPWEITAADVVRRCIRIEAGEPTDA